MWPRGRVEWGCGEVRTLARQRGALSSSVHSVGGGEGEGGRDCTVGTRVGAIEGGGAVHLEAEPLVARPVLYVPRRVAGLRDDPRGCWGMAQQTRSMNHHSRNGMLLIAEVKRSGQPVSWEASSPHQDKLPSAPREMFWRRLRGRRASARHLAPAAPLCTARQPISWHSTQAVTGCPRPRACAPEGKTANLHPCQPLRKSYQRPE